MNLPTQYRWLLQLQLPRVISEGLQLIGIREIPGPQNDPRIMEWARVIGVAKDYVADQIPWCGLFAGIVCHRSGWPVVTAPLWARNWAHWEDPSPSPGLGDILVFQRPSGGHVGFYIGEDSTAFHVLGGNQGDSVSIIRVAKSRMLAARRPRWRVAKPDSVKSYRLAATGGLSTNEA